MIKKYYKQVYANYFDNLDEMKTFLKTQIVKTVKNDIENLNTTIYIKEIGSLFQNFPT